MAVLMAASATDGGQSAVADAPCFGVRVVLVLPQEGEARADLQGRLTLVMKDVQWWYACQMKAHGYGARTFTLETGTDGQVVVHGARLAGPVPVEPDDVMRACVVAAEARLGTFGERRGTVMLVVYGDYIWRDRVELTVAAHGRGLPGRWAFITSWHMNNCVPEAWLEEGTLATYPNERGYFGGLHLAVLRVGLSREGHEPIGRIAAHGHGGIAHELGHGFGLHHKDVGDRVPADIMGRPGLTYIRGNFLPGVTEAACLVPQDAEVLAKNPLFHEGVACAAHNGAPDALGMRGARPAQR